MATPQMSFCRADHECQPQPHCAVEDHGRREAEATTDADSHSVTTNKSMTYIRETKIDLLLGAIHV